MALHRAVSFRIEMKSNDMPAESWPAGPRSRWCLTPAGGPEGAGAGPVPDREEIALYRTADGGRHWTTVPMPA